jgi:putative glutamine amidotransferase
VACWTYHSPVTAPRPRARTPRVGLSAYRETAQWGVWNEAADLLPASYSRAVVRAGGVPMILPPATEEAVETLLDGLHGLVVAGGADVDPETYGAVRDPKTGPARTERDGWEFALTRAALARNLPVLAICRGMQVLNVVLGGDLIQHLPDVVGSDEHCPTVGVHGRHPVTVAETSRLHGVLGATTSVPTYHHQAVDRLGAGLTAVAWAADGLVEAVEYADSDWVFGVQWHPEVAEGEPLFEAFVQACCAYRDGELGARADVGSPR